MHSSGTTGMPKGVEMSHYCLLLVSEIKNLDMTNAVSIWFSSLYWISGVMMNFKAIAQGAKVIIYPEFDEEMTCLLIEKYKVREELASRLQQYLTKEFSFILLFLFLLFYYYFTSILLTFFYLIYKRLFFIFIFIEIIML